MYILVLICVEIYNYKRVIFIFEFSLQFKFEIDNNANCNNMPAGLYCVLKCFSFTSTAHLSQKNTRL